MIYISFSKFSRIFIIICMVLGVGCMTNPAYAQESNPFEITFEQLGYAERTLEDPYSAVRYYFSLPTDWQPSDGTYTTFYLNFTYSGVSSLPPNLLNIRLNNQVILSTQFKAEGESTLRVGLPKELLYAPDTGLANVLEVEFISYVDCRNNTDARVLLLIRNSSFLHFAYTTQALTLDLKSFPAPLYFDQSLMPSNVSLVLSEEPSQAEFKTALVLAARLGASSRNKIPLSVIYANNLTPELAADKHLIVIGTPDTNPFITQMDLPVSAQPRSLELHSTMPATVLPDKPFTLDVTVKNSSETPQKLVLLERFPEGTNIDCQGTCTEQVPGLFQWEIGSLEVNQETSVQFQVTLESATFPQGSFFEHTASLIDEAGNIINGDSLTVPVDAIAAAEATNQIADSQVEKGDYFFAQETEAVADGDGIVQEIASPWNPGKAVIVVTGLSDEALLKAGQALGTTMQFPGMSGNFALVKSTTLLTETAPSFGEDITFSSLGYQDVKASFFEDLIQVNFDIPSGWVVDESANLMLHYSYSASMSTLFSTLEIGINGLPVKSILLDKQDTTDNLWATINIPKDYLQAGPNRVSINLISDYPECISYQVAQSFWARVFADSYLHLPHTVVPIEVKLEEFPYIFTAQPDLSDVIFALPTQVSQEQLQKMVLLASSLGYSAGGNQFNPSVVQDEVSLETFSKFNIIAYGRPTENLTISALNDFLPQPFVPNTDKILQSVDNIIYRMPDDYELGYLELIPSPWNTEKAILVITGTTDQGVVWSLDALLNDQLNYKLQGNLAILTSETELRALDTRAAAEDTVSVPVAELTPKAIEMPATMSTPTLTSLEETPDTKSPLTSRSALLWPLLGLSLLIIFITIYFTRKQKQV